MIAAAPNKTLRQPSFVILSVDNTDKIVFNLRLPKNLFGRNLPDIQKIFIAVSVRRKNQIIRFVFKRNFGINSVDHKINSIGYCGIAVFVGCCQIKRIQSVGNNFSGIGSSVPFDFGWNVDSFIRAKKISEKIETSVFGALFFVLQNTNRLSGAVFDNKTIGLNQPRISDIELYFERVADAVKIWGNEIRRLRIIRKRRRLNFFVGPILSDRRQQILLFTSGRNQNSVSRGRFVKYSFRCCIISN